ncbi:hypothetical protein ACFS07_10150 [Undibacterium arcticum]
MLTLTTSRRMPIRQQHTGITTAEKEKKSGRNGVKNFTTDTLQPAWIRDVFFDFVVNLKIKKMACLLACSVIQAWIVIPVVVGSSPIGHPKNTQLNQRVTRHRL